MKLTMKISVIVMTVITLVVAVLGTRQVLWPKSTDFENSIVVWGLIVLLGAFVIVQAVCLFVYPFQIKKIGFYLLHIGLIAMLVGSMIYFLTGIKIQGYIPVDPQGSTAQAVYQGDKKNLLKGDNYTANFSSFRFGLTDFSVEHYEPLYDVYKLDPSTKKQERIKTDVEINSEGVYDFGEYGKKSKDDLLVNGEYPEQIKLNDDGTIVASRRTTVKHYKGDVRIVNYETNKNYDETIEVNHPVRVNGWKIYLMNYDEQDHGATFIFKYDPGEYIMLAGLCMVMIGAFVACFVRPRQKAGDAQ